MPDYDAHFKGIYFFLMKYNTKILFQQISLGKTILPKQKEVINHREQKPASPTIFQKYIKTTIHCSFTRDDNS